ncbi:sigma-70 family RNA polymerase sigma factor [Paenibacillus mesophilus]|uniref:sigma-70 family RNA polymerase sigma factor n=1 Tax=Paenibacillus mesophilus TaxID=2582849 RepID=UPI00110E61FA|nr:sigma-70 family RNA polymerase sigma factor [Paenibacillus mesophilus]TMV46904.1 sigma-70 family RNA polymerase sigma factor [Paenibacillus mesophilus]
MNVQPPNELLQRIGNGDREAFGQLYESTRDQVYRTVYFLLNQKQDTSDVVSEVFMELLRSLPSYNDDKPFRSWLSGLTVRQARNWNRKLWRKFRLFERSKSMEIEELQEDAAVAVLREEDRSELRINIEQLPFRLKAVIVLRYYQDCTVEEISDILNIPAGTVKSRHHHALKKLRLLVRQPELAKEDSVHANG